MLFFRMLYELLTFAQASVEMIKKMYFKAVFFQEVGRLSALYNELETDLRERRLISNGAAFAFELVANV